MAVEAVEPLARQALDLAKNALLVNLRFMNAAFARLRPFPVRDATLATDGLHIRFDPATLARLYAAEPAELTRAYLHIVLHNVFLHLYPGPHVDVARWDAACDIVVERTISELDLPATRTARAERQRATMSPGTASQPQRRPAKRIRKRANAMRGRTRRTEPRRPNPPRAEPTWRCRPMPTRRSRTTSRTRRSARTTSCRKRLPNR